MSNEFIGEHPGPYPVYSSQTENEGIMGYIDSFMFEGDYLTWTTDGAHAGTVFKRQGQFNCTNVCGTLKPKIELNLAFLLHAISIETKRYVRLDINPKLMNNMMSRIRISFPPLEEQNAIAGFLTPKTRLIDRYIRNKRRLIKLLQEQKQAIINDCVTGKMEVKKIVDENGNTSFRIQTYAEYKDSGVEWLGKIPSHWEVKKIKHFSYVKGRIGWEGLKASEFIDEGPFLITGMHFKGGKVDWEACYHIGEERYNQSPQIHVKLDDLLITKDGTIGKVAYIDLLPGPASLNSHLLIIRPLKSQYLSKYLFWYFQTNIFGIYVNLRQTGTTFYGITQEEIENFKFACPSLNNQEIIVEYINQETSNIDHLIEKIHNQIKMMNEYRIRLIADIVTGKVDVRDIPVEDIPEDETLEELEDEQEELEELPDIEENGDGDD